ncbi:hypothetical protein HK100_010370 [Physocladia obscura]|uniref:Uncharacterized protein n=1 Tax=Physocladia obscura TaxID=109957 RepID=A0AAD5TBL7_9FUNG|nr:hypothetical protein HK100_010370 [Physocladia obscura]
MASAADTRRLALRTLIADSAGHMYNWTQTESNVIFSARIAAGVERRDVDVDVRGGDSITVSVRGDVLLRGRLYATVGGGVDVMIRPIVMADLSQNPKQESANKDSNKENNNNNNNNASLFNSSIAAINKAVNPFFRILIVRLVKATRKNVWPLPIHGGLNSPADADPHSLYLIANTSTSFDLDDKAALKLMVDAADAGSVAAMLKLAAWFEIGKEEMSSLPVYKNEKESVNWHSRAGNAGNAEACYILMTTCASGTHGIPKSYSEALKWSRAAFQCGFGDIHDGGCMAIEQPNLYQTLLFQSGLLLMEGGFGIGDPKPESAVASWTTAAKEGHPQSAWNLGIFYLNGFGLKEPNVTRGIELIRSGMSIVKELGLPPQLTGLSQSALDNLIDADAEMRAQGSVLDIEKLKVLTAMKMNGQLNSSLPATSTKSLAKSASASIASTASSAETKATETIKSKDSKAADAAKASAAAKKNQRRREKERLKKLEERNALLIGDGSASSATSFPKKDFDWSLTAQRIVAVAAISVGVFGLWKVSKGSI